jgi:tetratricopeptide (TPR) repeat protein
MGEPEKGIKLIEKAMRLDPIHSDQDLGNLGNAYRALGRYEDAIKAYRRVLQRSPNNLFVQIDLTATYSAAGREQEALHQAQEVLKIDPSFSLDKWAETIVRKDMAEAQLYIESLRKAGLK